MSNLLKNLLIVLALAFILFVGYLAFRGGSEGSELGDTQTFSREAELETQQLLITLRELKSLNVSGDIFANPIFLSLKDLRVDLQEEASGRPNPFEPVQ